MNSLLAFDPKSSTFAGDIHLPLSFVHIGFNQWAKLKHPSVDGRMINDYSSYS